MGQKILASLRLGFALVCVGASLILAAQWFGFLPDAALAEARARRNLCETVAVQSVGSITRQRWIDLSDSMQMLVDRDPELMSVGVRNRYGRLLVDTGHHSDMWPTKSQPMPSVEPIQIPIMMRGRPWGHLEFCYHHPERGLIDRAMSHPLLRMVGFFIVSGMFAYTIFVVRIMGVFTKTQVVPDRVRQALDTLAEGLLILDGDGRIVLANRAFGQLVGTDSDNLTHRKAAELAWLDDDVKETGYPWLSVIETSEMQTEKMLRITLEDGSQRILSVNAAPLGKDRSMRGALATFRDVTHVETHRAEQERMLSLLRSSRDEIQRKNRALEILATQDSLTGCFNRRAFFEKFDSLWSESVSTDQPLSCIMVDVDHFKSVNDTFGHHTGDEVLRAVAMTIRQLHETHGVVCRYGGEEFCILLPMMDVEMAMAEAERTRKAIMAIRLEDPEQLRLTASLGVSELRFGGKVPQDLVNQADACLYVAKREGRNRAIVYNTSYERLEETEKLKDSVKRDEIEIPFQAVSALVAALSYRDIDTAEHSRRVANLCARASDGLFDPVQKYVLEVAALLHDIGKIGVPDHILLKPGPLTQDEWEIMRRHDRIGVEIVSGSFDCPQLAAVMSNHHAHFSGNPNDPDLPIGEQIPMAARLLCIADSYDAMVSDRVYRKGQSHEQAVAELRACSGTQFDPALVEHFIEKIAGVHATVATGAIAVRKQAAIEIGSQVQQIAEAILAQDPARLRSLASDVTSIATAIDLPDVAQASRRIEHQASDESCEWNSLIRQTNELLDLCRSTQNDYLRNSLEREAEQLNH